MDKVCYNLNEEELEEIENLYEKKVALENLSRCIDPDNEKMYQKLVNDYTSTIKKFNNWWKKMQDTYNWEGTDWKVDFATGNVYIIRNQRSV